MQSSYFPSPILKEEPLQSSVQQQRRIRSRSNDRRRHLTQSMHLAASTTATIATSPSEGTIASTTSRRRETHGFLKYGQPRTTSNMARSREHAKQIAQALSSHEDDNTDGTTNNYNNNSGRADEFADFGSAFANSDPFADMNFDTFSNNNTTSSSKSKNDTLERLYQSDPQEEATESTTQTAASSNTNEDFFALDPFTTKQSTPMMTTTTATNSNERKNRSRISNIFHKSNKSDIVKTTVRRPPPPPQQQPHRSNTIDMFSDPGLPTDWPVVRVSAILDSPAAKKAVSSTGPSNNRRLKQSQQQQQQSPWNTPEKQQPSSQMYNTNDINNNNSGGGGGNGSITEGSLGAAARRRVRSHMRKGGAGGSSMSSDNLSNNQTTVSAESNMSPQTMLRYPKNTDHVANYSRQNYNSRTTSASSRSVIAATQQPTSGIRSVASSSGSSNTENTNRMMFELDTKNHSIAAGFSFDAFGLDKAEMDRQVGEAMHDLAGSGQYDISMFFQPTTDDFAQNGWGGGDELTSASPCISGAMDESVLSNTTPTKDGFVDGFRVTKPLHNVRQLPNSPGRALSDRSSLTSESHDVGGGGGVNMFKEQAGFHRSKTSNRKPTLTSPVSSEQRSKGSNMRMNGFRSPTSPGRAKSQNLLPQIPYIDTVSPRMKKDKVEFFGEDSSASSAEIFKSSLQSSRNLAQQQPAGRKAVSDIVTDNDFASDVGVSSDYVGANSRTDSNLTAKFTDHLMSFVNVKEKKGVKTVHVKSESVQTESTAATTTATNEEKKDDELGVSPDKSIQLLRSKWETHESRQSREIAQRLRERQKRPSALPRDEIARLQAKLGSEILSPEKLMPKQSLGELIDKVQPTWRDVEKQQERATECHDQRTSFISTKERLRSPIVPRPENVSRYNTSSKSEGGSASTIRHSSVSAILTNFEKKNSPIGDSRSDIGESPTLYGVRLRKTGLSQDELMTPKPSPGEAATFGKSPNSAGWRTPTHSDIAQRGFESQTQRTLRQQQRSLSQNTPLVQNRQSPSSRKSSPGAPWVSNSPLSNCRSSPKVQKEYLSPKATNDDSSPQEETPEKKLTYRERRELELQKEKEIEKNQSEQQVNKSSAQRDVASLIKRRIAANKQKAPLAASTSAVSSNPEEIISSVKNQLRPSSVHSDTTTLPLSPKSSSKINDPSPHLDHCSSPARSITYTEAYSPDSKPSRQQADINPVAQLMSRRAAAASPGPIKPPSPARAKDSAPADLEIDVDPQPSMNKRVAANPAVTHMMILQQLQRENPEIQSKTQKSPRDIPHDGSVEDNYGTGAGKTPKATKMMLNAFLAGRESISSLDLNGTPSVTKSAFMKEEQDTSDLNPASTSHGIPPLKEDPKYERYFKMLKLGMPMDVVKHAMTRDGIDPTVMDGDHNKPVGVPLKDDPEYTKYFKMLKIGLPMEAVKHSMERDGLDSGVMDQDHDMPVALGKKSDDEPKEIDSHRRARLHWNTLRKVTSNSLWAQIDQDESLQIEIDEKEFNDLFQAEKTDPAEAVNSVTALQLKRSSAVRVIDPKRANNGGIILARLKMSHDDMADTVDRIDEHALTAEQIENIIEYLPTKEEGKALEAYMLEGGQDAAEKFDGLCECEKFMVSMMTVKHAKRKVSALLFKLQFESCICEIQQEARAIEQACKELNNSVRLRQLLGIVLTFGNRLNTAGNGKRKAGAFTLDSLLKLKQAKAFDKKTTFLHYIVLIVQRNNEQLLNFKEDIPTVFTSDKIFWDQCVADLEEVENQLENVRKIALYQAHQSHAYRRRRRTKKEDPDESLSDGDETLTLEDEVEALRATPIGTFTLSAIKYVSALRDKVESTKDMFAHLLEYFGEQERKMQPHELFSIIVRFSRDFETAKEEVFETQKRKQREERKILSRTPNTQPKGTQRTNSPRILEKTLKSLKAEPVIEVLEQQHKLRNEEGISPSRIDPADVKYASSPQSRDKRSDDESSFDNSPPNIQRSHSSPRSSQTKARLESVPIRSTSSMAAARAKARLRMNRSSGSESSPTSRTGSRSISPDLDTGALQPQSPRSAQRAEV